MIWSQVAAAGTLWRCPLDETRAATGAVGAAPRSGCTSLNESTLESGQNPASAAVLHEHYNEGVYIKEQCSSKLLIPISNTKIMYTMSF